MSNHEEQSTDATSAPPPLPPPHDAQQHNTSYPHHHHYMPPGGHAYPPQQTWNYPPPPLPPNHHAYNQAPPPIPSGGKKSASSSPNNNNKPPSIIHSAKSKKDQHPTEEEPKVDPMKQDFHFYAAEHCPSLLTECQRKLSHAHLPANNTYLSTTLLNAALIYNWETSPQGTRTHYLKLEEADRKRFMSEDEVASRHCATLTARKRSPKVNVSGNKDVMVEGGGGGVENARSFGLGEVVPRMVGVLAENGEGEG
jgi:hypothetical protein